MTDTSPLVSIVVLCYNGSPHLKTCLDSIEHLTYKNIEVILVDNASTDNSVDIVKSNYPWVRIVSNDRNLGYTGGNNVGARVANGKYIFFLNQDTEIDCRCLDNLVNVIEKDDKIGICGCKILLFYNRHYFHHAGGEYNLIGITLDRGRYDFDEGQYNKVENVTFANGVALLVRKNLLRKIGLFDPKFFAYNEDVDICLRAWMSGNRVVYVPKAVVYHKLGANFGRLSPITIFHASKNNLIILFKNISPREMLFLPMLAFAYRVALITAYLKKREPAKARAVMSAAVWAFKNISHIMCERTALKSVKTGLYSEFINAKIRTLRFQEYWIMAERMFSLSENKNL